MITELPRVATTGQLLTPVGTGARIALSVASQIAHHGRHLVLSLTEAWAGEDLVFCRIYATSIEGEVLRIPHILTQQQYEALTPITDFMAGLLETFEKQAADRLLDSIEAFLERQQIFPFDDD